MLQQFREKHGLSQEGLADKLGVGWSTIYKRERSGDPLPRVWELALAEVEHQLERERREPAGPGGEPKQSGGEGVKSV